LNRQAQQQALDELAAPEQTLAQAKSNKSEIRNTVAELETAVVLLSRMHP
jgi:hypothetical protein